MKRTSDRLATFINKKLTQAATVFEPQSSAPPPPPPPTHQEPPQHGQPLCSTTSSDHAWGADLYYSNSGTQGSTPMQDAAQPPVPGLGNDPYFNNHVTPCSTSMQGSVQTPAPPVPPSLSDSFHKSHGMPCTPSMHASAQPPVPPVPPSLSDSFHKSHATPCTPSMHASAQPPVPPVPPSFSDSFHKSHTTPCTPSMHASAQPPVPPALSESFHKSHVTPRATPHPPHPPVPPPVTNAALDSPYPPSGFDYEQPKQDSRFQHPQTPVLTQSNVSMQSSQTSYALPSPYVLPPSTGNVPQPGAYPQASNDDMYYHQRKTFSAPEPPRTPSDLSANFQSYHSLPLSATTPSPNSFHSNKPGIPRLHHLIRRRLSQAKSSFPHAVIPLSRSVNASNDADLELWRYQLATQNALAMQPTPVQNLPEAAIFTLSLTDTNFSNIEWKRLKRVLSHLSTHHNPLHMTLPPPSHTRLLPCATFPVISLSPFSTTLSSCSSTTPWRFLEEVSGCWGGGVIYACETRGSSVTGIRDTLRYTLRRELPVPKCMKHTLRNVLFGAVIAESEISEMADWTFRKGLAVGVDWRERLVNGVGGELLPPRGVWLDGSRTVDGCWKGGVEGMQVSKCIRVGARDQTFFLARFGDEGEGVWVLVGDVGKRVWSKIVCGEESIGAEMGHLESWVRRVLTGMVGRVEVLSVASCDVKELG